MPKKRKRSPPAETQARPQQLVQAPLKSFFQAEGALQLRGRAVPKKTIKGSKGQYKHKDFECTSESGFVAKVPTKQKDARGRDRVGTVELKTPSKKFRMKSGQMAGLLKKYPVLEMVSCSDASKYLRCSVCYDFVLDSQIKSTPSHIDEHMKTSKHQKNASQKERQMEGVQSIKSAFKIEAMTPDDSTNVFRARCVEAFVGAGIPLQKVDACRDFLQFYCKHQLTASSHLRNFVPTLREVQRKEIKDAAAKYPLFIVHDGTNRFSEFYAIVVRWVDDLLNLNERLVEMESFTGKHNAAGLLELLLRVLRDLGVDPGDRFCDPPRPGGLLGSQRDREATNAAASEGLVHYFHCALNFECCSHGLNTFGEKFKTPSLVTFKDQLVIACNSSAFKEHCKRFVNKTFRKPSSIRWWSIWELYASFLEEVEGTLVFDRYLEAFRAARDQSGHIAVPGATDDSIRIGRLADFAHDAAALDAVRLELVCVVSVCKPFVQATYALEGAGCCSMEVYKWLSDLRFWLSEARLGDLSFPGLRTQIEASAQFRAVDGLSLEDSRAAVEREVRSIILPAMEFCRRVFDEAMAPDFEFYKFCSSLNPCESLLYFQHNTVEQWLQALKKWFGERFTQIQMDAMHAELPTLRRHVDGFLAQNLPNTTSADRNLNIWNFWRQLLRIGECPHLRSLVQLVLTVVPSSASCERCFSLLKSMFTAQQLVGEERGVLEDSISLSVATRFRANNLENKFHASLGAAAPAAEHNPILIE